MTALMALVMLVHLILSIAAIVATRNLTPVDVGMRLVFVGMASEVGLAAEGARAHGTDVAWWRALSRTHKSGGTAVDGWDCCWDVDSGIPLGVEAICREGTLIEVTVDASGKAILEKWTLVAIAVDASGEAMLRQEALIAVTIGVSGMAISLESTMVAVAVDASGKVNLGTAALKAIAIDASSVATCRKGVLVVITDGVSGNVICR